MFETAELGRAVAKKDFEAVIPGLRVELVDLQQRLRSAGFPVLVLFSGVNGAGKSETINLLNEWMDPRWIESSAYQPPSDEERERPRFWRYWRDVPAKGRLGLFLSAWYSRPFLDHVYGASSAAEYEAQLDECAGFERVLADDGALILKFWMHLGRAQQKRRLKALEKDPLQRWRITELDWKHWRMYERFIEVAEQTIRATSIPQAPWQIVEGMDPHYRSLTVATAIRDAVSARLAVRPPNGSKLRRRTDPDGAVPAERAGDAAAAILDGTRRHNVLTDLDMRQTASKDEYAEELPRQQGRVNSLFREARERGVSLVCVFEGWDASGKGGAIRRLTRALDARDYRVIPIAAPNDEEAAHHYLWRFWRQLRRSGRVTIFDRSWYGRVLVERVEGLASPLEWRRAYSEINQFERQLTCFGIVLVKFWLHVTPEEQLRRFEERQSIDYKRWKITDEDWRNREKWELYERAVQEMVERTSALDAPWTLVEANCKRSARLKVLRTVAEALEGALAREGDGHRSGSERSTKRKKA
jgi:polyphosphate:AMP phosphotransferase